MRIASLLPSATEIVCALGLTENLVGISHDCDYPPEIRSKPVLSEAIVTTALPSGVIDARIREQVHKGKSVYHLDETQLAALQPDLILTQELCEVCAPSYTLVAHAAKVLEGQTKLVSLEPLVVADILETIRMVGTLTGTSERAHTLVTALEARINRVKATTAGLTPPRVACLEWLDPVFVAGHWVPEMVELAGGRDMLGRPGQPSFVVDWDAVRAAAPEILILMPCGFDVPRIRDELNLLEQRDGWADLPAVRTKQVYLTDASAYFSRPGPRIAQGIEILAAILHPEAFAHTLPPGAFAPAYGAHARPFPSQPTASPGN